MQEQQLISDATASESFYQRLKVLFMLTMAAK